MSPVRINQRYNHLEVEIELVHHHPNFLSQDRQYFRATTPRRPRYQSTRSNDQPSNIRRSVFLCGVCMATFNTLAELKAHEDLKHFCCKICSHRCYRNKDELDKHHKEAHPHTWCRFCREHFDTNLLSTIHRQTCHKYCRQCNKHFKDLNDLNKHIAERHTEHLPPPAAATVTKKPVVGKYYTLLNISPTASHEDILKAARQARIKVHPDRLYKPELPDRIWAEIVDKAKEVGRAADVLCDVSKRLDYDSDVKRGKME